MHIVETAFRQFKADNPVFAETVSRYASLLRGNPEVLPDLPQVAAPTANFHLALAAIAPNLPRYGMDYVNELAQAGNQWMAYRENKHVYQITPELTKELAKLRQPLTLQARALHLPRRGIVLDFSAYVGEDHPAAYLLLAYDTVMGGDHDAQKGKPTLAVSISRLAERGRLKPLMVFPCDLRGRSIWEAHLEMLRGNRAHLAHTLESLQEEHGGYPERMTRLAPLMDQWNAEVLHYDQDLAQTPEEFLEAEPTVALAINTLFYLQGDPDVVKVVHPGMAPQRVHAPKHAPNLQKLNRRLDLQEPTTQVVGERFTAAIQHYEIERKRLQSTGNYEGSKAPHLRRPHLHTYRCGEDHLDVCLRFLGWIGVGGAEVPQALKEAFVTITPVK